MNKYKRKSDFTQEEINEIMELYITPFYNFSSLAKKFSTYDDTIREILAENNVPPKSKIEAHSSANINMELTEKNNLFLGKKKIYFNSDKTPFVFFSWKNMQRRRYLCVVKCDNCGKNIFSLKGNKSNKRACSKKCQYNMIKGSKHANWTGGVRVKASGYIMDYKPDHPNAVQRYVLRHRLIMEAKIGRYLTKNEYIHHIDFNKKNNNINNLFLCNKEKHIEIHNNIHNMLIKLIQKNILIFNKESEKYEIR